MNSFSESGHGSTSVCERQDTSRRPLKEQLNDIIAGFILAGASLHRWGLEREEAERQRIAAEQRCREIEEAGRKKEQELRDLLTQVESWQRTTQIRSYVEAVRSAVAVGKRAIDRANLEQWAA